MTLVICPGIHDGALTDRFLRALALTDPEHQDYHVVPTESYPPFSGVHIYQFLQQYVKPAHLGHALNRAPLALIAYSAGVVGAIGAAWGWHQQGGQVQVLIALDGWGVPLVGPFPIYRVSHDYFTHWSSAWLGQGPASFYADPPVPHLALWCQPETVSGWWVCQGTGGTTLQSPTTAATFITTILAQHLQ